MELRHECAAAILEALHQHISQSGLLRSSGYRGELLDDSSELSHSAGSWRDDAMDVVLGAKLRIVCEHRPAETEGDLAEPLAKGRQLMDALLYVSKDVLAVEAAARHGRRIEDQRAQGVHGHRRHLGVHEDRVFTGEASPDAGGRRLRAVTAGHVILLGELRLHGRTASSADGDTPRKAGFRNEVSASSTVPPAMVCRCKCMQHGRRHRGLEATIVAAVHEMPRARDRRMAGAREQLRNRSSVFRGNQRVALCPHERGGNLEARETRPGAGGSMGFIERHLACRR